MAGGTFNIAKGRIIEKISDDNSKLTILLLKTAEDKSTLEDYVSVDAMLASAGNVEADFTNYARITDIIGSVSVDNVESTASADMDDQSFDNAGGAVNNTLAKIIIAYQEGADDTTLIPLTHHDFTVTTSGNNIPVVINQDGFYTSSEPA